jgi:adenylate kinase
MKRTEIQADNADTLKGQGAGGSLAPATINSPELEVKDEQLIFSAVWRELEGELGRSRMRFPRELILLGGAPGAGKGTNSDFIRKVRGIDAPAIVVSKLLDTPEARAIKARGGMVGDREVVSILFRKLLEPEQQNGALIDGFPRTKVQVECLKLLYHEMIALRREFSGTPEVIYFKQPIFQIMVLFVDEAESVARQLKRGRQVVAHNEEVARSGVGERWEERATDASEGLARNRYRVFKEQTYDALVSLKQIFHYHFINAQAPIPEVQDNIVRELEYQSSLELDPDTFDRLRGLPLASEIVRHARQDLVRRLDGYEVQQAETFRRVIDFIETKMMPIVVRHAVSGVASINSEDVLFEDPAALAMLIDVFSERGFHAAVDVTRVGVPVRIDLQTGEIYSQEKRVFRFTVRFRSAEIRG